MVKYNSADGDVSGSKKILWLSFVKGTPTKEGFTQQQLIHEAG